MCQVKLLGFRINKVTALFLIILTSISILQASSRNTALGDTDGEPASINKLSPQLASCLAVSENSEAPLDVIADLHPNAQWVDAQRAILQADPYARIRAYHNLIHAISIRTTVRGVHLLAGVKFVRKIWTDTKTHLDPVTDLTLELQTKILSKYLPPQEIVSTSPLTAQGFNGSHIIVSILDTGIDTTHPDLDDFDDNESTNDLKVVGQVSFVEGDPFPFDLNGHGTYCAGLIAGTGTASWKYRGIAPGAQLLSAKVLLANGTGYTSWIIRGVEWSLTHGTDIILLPFSTFGMPGDPLSEAIREVAEQGVLVIAAAGDDGPNHMTIMSPGESIAALTVGAFDSATEMVAEFSSRGPTFDMRSKPDLVAPGVNIISCSLYEILPIDLGDDSSLSIGDSGLSLFGLGEFGQTINENYTRASTTAAAASIAAGVACLLLQACQFATPESLIIAMCEGAKFLKGEPNTEGHGLLNASAAYDELASLHDPYDPGFRTRSITPGLTYYGIVMSGGETDNVTMMMSTYATAMAAILSTNTTNMTIAHLLMGMFFLAVGNATPTPFAFLDVEQEMHWTTLPNADYTRTTGILSYGDLLIIPRIESWRITSEPFANAFRFTFFILNVGEEEFQDVRICSLWNFDLFMGANITSEEAGTFNDTSQFFHVEANASPPNETALINQSIGFNTSTPLTSFEVGPYDDVYDHLMNEALNGSDSYSSEEGIGVGTRWDLGKVTVGAPAINVT